MSAQVILKRTTKHPLSKLWGRDRGLYNEPLLKVKLKPASTSLTMPFSRFPGGSRTATTTWRPMNWLAMVLCERAVRISP